MSISRARLQLARLGSDPQLAIMRSTIALPAHATAMADVIAPERGWLLKMERTGTYAIWLAAGGLRSVDQRKAQAALNALDGT